MTSCVVQS